jgi:hypothetical protein
MPGNPAKTKADDFAHFPASNGEAQSKINTDVLTNKSEVTAASDEEESVPPAREGSGGSGGGGAGGDALWFCDAGCNGVVCVTVERPAGADPVRLLAALWALAGGDGGGLDNVTVHTGRFCHRFLPFQVPVWGIISFHSPCSPSGKGKFRNSMAPSSIP